MIAADREIKIEQILEGLKEGLPEYQAAKNAGITWNTFWNWKEADPGLRLRVEDAKRARIGILEDALYKAAMKGNVTACLTLLRKHSREWKEELDGSILPSRSSGQEVVAIASAAAAGAASVLKMLTDEKRDKLKAAMRREGMIIDVNPAPPEIGRNGANGTNGNGKH